MSQVGKGIYLNLDPAEHRRLKIAAAEGEISMTEVTRQALAIWHGLSPDTRSGLLKQVGYILASANGAATADEAAGLLLQGRLGGFGYASSSRAQCA